MTRPAGRPILAPPAVPARRQPERTRAGVAILTVTAVAVLTLAVTAPVTAPVAAQAATGPAQPVAAPAPAQPMAAPVGGGPLDYRDEALRHFEQSSRKMVLLSEAVPAELYDWSPGEGVMSVARVYAHIARYNYLYLTENLEIPAPPDVAWQELESLTDRAAVREALLASIEHVRRSVSAMEEEDLTRTVSLYGRDVPGWSVLFQLVAHMNEHVGQSIAYARMNGIVPPWSR